MNKLFIIGNGFDIAHKIPSRYEDFRLYLISLLNQIDIKYTPSYDYTDSSIITTDYESNEENDILTIMYFLSNAEQLIEWNNVEKSVGELNYDEFSWIYRNESENDKEYKANLINEDTFLPYAEVLESIPNYFSSWIKQLKIDDYKKNVKSELVSLFSDYTKFLCFNYTDTLECLYNVNPKNICYIHGKAKNDKLYFGHGNKKTYDDFLGMQNDNWLSVAEGYDSVNEILHKPVKKIIKQNSKFFESICDVDEVYSYGFSYNQVDEPYVSELVSRISKNAKWKLHSYPSEDEKRRYKTVVLKCGYKNLIEEF